jgi:hypothetical protein
MRALVTLFRLLLILPIGAVFVLSSMQIPWRFPLLVVFVADRYSGRSGQNS